MRLPQVSYGVLQFWRDRAECAGGWPSYMARETSPALVCKDTSPCAHRPHRTVQFPGNLHIRSSIRCLLPDRNSLLKGRFLSNSVHDVFSSSAIWASGEHHTIQLNDRNGGMTLRDIGMGTI